jgi:hypothetical protein
VRTFPKPRVVRASLPKNHLISRRSWGSWSHEFENVRKEMWACFVGADTRVKCLFYDPLPSRLIPTPAKRRAKRAPSRMNGRFPA